ncbi:MAG: Ig-like domain-containing protein [Patescibacteria group bacterium]
MALFQLSPSRKRWWVIGIAVVLVAVGGTFGFMRWRSANPTTGGTSFDKVIIPKDDSQKQFTFTPTKSDRLGVDPSTAFTLKATTAIAKKDIEASLSFMPKVAFAVAEKGSNEFTITPTAPLTAAAVYKIALGATVQGDAGPEKQTFSWAVQAKQALAVEGTLPRDKATGVPLDTGIEMTFTTDKLVQPEASFTILPATDGRFEQHGRVLAFIPTEKLKQATVYTVTIKKGLQATDSDVTLTTDFTFQFETSNAGEVAGYSYYGSFDPAFHAVRPKEAPVIDAGYVGENLNGVAITVYAFADAKELMSRLQPLDVLPQWAYAARERMLVDINGLRSMGQFTPTLEKHEYQTLVHLPSGFDAGNYLIDMALDGKQHLQSVMVVSDIGAALYATQTDAVLWVKDLSTKQSLTAATVTSADGAQTATVDADGVARIKTPVQFNAGDATATSRDYYTITAKDGRSLVVPLTLSPYFGYNGMGGGGSTNPDYWSYLSTDRSLYRSDDTVNIWGVARVRTAKDIAPRDLTLEVWSWNVVDGNGNYQPLQTQTVTTEAYGSYKASLTLRQLKPGSYTLSLRDASSHTIRTQSFEVQTFTKPAYQILVTPDKLAGFNGEKVTYSIRTQFFDGTPAPNIALGYDGYGQAEMTGSRVTTDGQGRATVNQTIFAPDSSRTETNHESFVPVNAAEGDIFADTNVIGFPSGVAYNPEGSFTETAATAAFTLRTVDLGKVTPTNYWEAQLTGDVVPNAPVTGTVYEQVMHKTKSGQEYNFIEKKVVDTYNYNVTEEKREVFTGVTDSQGKFAKAFTLTGDTYTVKFSVKDAQGRPATRTLWLFRDGYRWAHNNSGYTMSTSEQDGTESGPATTYKIGASTDIRMSKGNQSIAGQGPFLFLKLQNGIQEVSVKDASVFSYTVLYDDAPNISFAGAYFDGSTFQLAGETGLTVDITDRALTIAVTPEQKSYGPGDVVKANVHVTDILGKPVQAMVNLSAIDAAIVAIQTENAPTPLQSLYTNVPSGLLLTYVSHDALKLNGGAERGGGGDQPRKIFKDAVLFQNVETDRDGNATVTFTVPDNLTSWQVTAQAVTKDLKAGHTTVGIPVTKSIFGTLTLAAEYVVADVPKAIANAYGVGLTPADDVQFTLETPGIGKVQTRTGKAFTAQSFTMPKLAVGPQEIRLTVQRGNDKDILVRTVQVLSSRVTKAESAYLDASVGQTIAPAGPGRTSLTFSDAGRGRVVQALQALQWAYGKRVERYLGSRIAVDLLNDLKVDATATTSFVPNAFQQEDGGISQVTYGSSDLTTSAYAAARGDLFDSGALARYFTAKLEQKDASLGQQGLALLGLANLGKPVLADLDSFLQQPDIDAQDQLTAALAYLALGSNDKAIAIAAALWQKYGTVETPFAKLSLGAGDSVIINTARFSILAEGLKLPQRQGIARYLETNFPKDAVTNLERSLAMRAAVPLLDAQTVSLTYEVSSKASSLELKNGETKTASLTTDELKSFSVTAVQGPVSIVTSTFAPVDIRTAKVDKRLGIDRSYTNMKAGKTSFEQGDLVRVDITPKVSKDVADQQFYIVDELPSGFILITNPWNHGIGDTYVEYPIDVDHQRVTFWSGGSRAIHYYARVFTPGGYAAEPTLIQGQSSRDLVNYSGAQSLEIK